MQASAGPTSAVDATNTTHRMASMPRYCQNSTPKVTAAIMGTEHSSSRMPASQIWEASRVKISKKRAAPFLRGASLGTPGPSFVEIKTKQPHGKNSFAGAAARPCLFFSGNRKTAGTDSVFAAWVWIPPWPAVTGWPVWPPEPTRPAQPAECSPQSKASACHASFCVHASNSAAALVVKYAVNSSSPSSVLSVYIRLTSV